MTALATSEKRRAYGREWRARNQGYRGPSYLSKHNTGWRDEARCCKQCGASFSPKIHNQVHCSTECKRAYAAARYEPKRAVSKRDKAREAYQIMTYGKVLNDPILMDKDRYRRARAEGYRSGLEVKVARELEAKGVPFEYESFKIDFTRPAKKAKYMPDIRLPNGIIVELKGRFVTEDRAKHVLIKEQHPHLDIRFVFSNSKTTISKTSKTTYADWCRHKGFLFADKSIPQEWIDEPPKSTTVH